MGEGRERHEHPHGSACSRPFTGSTPPPPFLPLFSISCATPHRHVKRCHNVGDVARMGEGSKVVIATGLSLECGLSRELLVKWGGDGRNAVIFTQQPPVSVIVSWGLLASAAAGKLTAYTLRALLAPQ
jgi:hypothetical protein